MAELEVDQTEIGVIIMGLTALEDNWLTDEGKAACARLAHKLGFAAAKMRATGGEAA